LPQQVLLPYIEQKLEKPSKGNSIEFSGIEFCYPLQDNSSLRVLENLNLSFALHDHYAIMGETGAGKSTIFKGLAGLLKPTKGKIFVAGETVDTTSLEWRRNVGVVMQESMLFNRSLRENLTYGLDENNLPYDDVIIRTLEKVKMRQTFLEKLPNGLDTIIQDHGNEFSGGQRQRLQIARLLLRNKRIVLLDEFTSALDAATMQDILSILKEFVEEKTLVMITHDVQTLELANHHWNLQVGGKLEKLSNQRRGPGVAVTAELVAEDSTTPAAVIASNDEDDDSIADLI